MAAELIADCPRCPANKITFEALKSIQTSRLDSGWITYHEVFSVCRNCQKSTVFVLRQRDYADRGAIGKEGPLGFRDSLNNHFEVTGYISSKDDATIEPPENIPPDIESVFREGATCAAVQCWNAAGTMFRACVDLATKPLLPPSDGEQPEGLNWKTRRDLGARLPWLFKQGLLPSNLAELSSCIHQDGNDGAHDATLKKVDAEDLLDFTHALLTRLYTEPARLKAAQERRSERRAQK